MGRRIPVKRAAPKVNRWMALLGEPDLYPVRYAGQYRLTENEDSPAPSEVAVELHAGISYLWHRASCLWSSFPSRQPAFDLPAGEHTMSSFTQVGKR
jgi:hypothetical protein